MPLARRCVAGLLIAGFLALGIVSAQAKRAKLIVVVTEDDRPTIGSKVVIEPTGLGVEWPKDQNQMDLTTDERGRARARLGVGQYRVTAYHPFGARLPAATLVTIPVTSLKPVEIRLVLQYWDCTKLTCEL